MSKKTTKNFSKRPFLLLEILIAFSLLALVIVPLVKKPIESYQTQLQAIKTVEKIRLADLSFAKIKIDLLQESIPWKKLPSKEKKEFIYPLDDAFFSIPFMTFDPLGQRAVCRYKGEKISRKGEIVRLLEIEIQFAPFDKETSHKHLYHLIVKRPVSE